MSPKKDINDLKLFSSLSVHAGPNEPLLSLNRNEELKLIHHCFAWKMNAEVVKELICNISVKWRLMHENTWCRRLFLLRYHHRVKLPISSCHQSMKGLYYHFCLYFQYTVPNFHKLNTFKTLPVCNKGLVLENSLSSLCFFSVIPVFLHLCHLPPTLTYSPSSFHFCPFCTSHRSLAPTSLWRRIINIMAPQSNYHCRRSCSNVVWPVGIVTFVTYWSLSKQTGACTGWHMAICCLQHNIGVSDNLIRLCCTGTGCV